MEARGRVPFLAPALPGSGSKGRRLGPLGSRAVSQHEAPLGTGAMMGSSPDGVKLGELLDALNLVADPGEVDRDLADFFVVAVEHHGLGIEEAQTAGDRGHAIHALW